MRAFTLEFPVRTSPEAVRRWWTEFPSDYRATDPDEEPFRIVTTGRLPDGTLVLAAHFRGRFGGESVLEERLRVLDDAHWEVAIDAAGTRTTLDYRVAPAEGGATLTVTESCVATTPLAWPLVPGIALWLRLNSPRNLRDSIAVLERS